MFEGYSDNVKVYNQICGRYNHQMCSHCIIHVYIFDTKNLRIEENKFVGILMVSFQFEVSVFILFWVTIGWGPTITLVP